MSLWQQLGAISGAAGVGFAAYGAHAKIDENARRSFGSANQMHLFHSIVLLTLSQDKPSVTGPLFALGTLFFSGNIYYNSITGEKSRFSRLAPVGGILLMAGWVSCLF
eukprot:c24316_g1_i1.p1 GENE.c24316_g1_i1~~c24316_g1_i1.p1  ORF type:complete len:108 (+),score=35.04 c24316_g1_i1:55-378(+)